jgi:hypothetical protein
LEAAIGIEPMNKGFAVLIGAVSGCFWQSISARQAVEKSGKNSISGNRLYLSVSGCFSNFGRPFGRPLISLFAQVYSFDVV